MRGRKKIPAFDKFYNNVLKVFPLQNVLTLESYKYLADIHLNRQAERGLIDVVEEYGKGYESDLVRAVLSFVWCLIGGDNIKDSTTANILFFFFCQYAYVGIENIQKALMKVLRIDEKDMQRIGEIINELSKNELESILVNIRRELDAMIEQQNKVAVQKTSFLNRFLGWLGGIGRLFKSKK